jgi:hypothetical protein
MKNIGEISMKHVKVCKPKSLEAKENNVNKATTGTTKVAAKKTTVLSTEGLGCVPTGRIIDRD